MNKPKAVGYARVSTKAQADEGYSIGSQKQSIREWSEKNDHNLVRIFVDKGKSATTAERPQFKKMLDYCIYHNVSVCIVWHTDRFARNELIHALYKRELLKCGVKLISVTQPMIDTTPEGYLLDGVLANLNAYYSRDLGRKTKKGMMRKWESGWYPGPAPLGYKNVTNPHDKSKKIIVWDKKLAPHIQAMFRLYSTGRLSIQQLIEMFNQRGFRSKDGKELCHSTIHQILSNEFYYGRMSWGGLTKIGNHKPFISKELFDCCRYIRAKHRQFLIRRRKHSFVLCSFIYCGYCGRRYTAEWHNITRSKKRDKIAYYHCTQSGGCYSKYVEKEDLERKISVLFKQMQFADKFINLIRQKTQDAVENSRRTIDIEKRDLLNQLGGVEKRRNKIEDKFTSDQISHEVYVRQHGRVQSEIDGINQQLADVENKRTLDFSLIEEVLNMTRNIYQTYNNAPDFMKQHYLRFFFERIEVKNQKVSKIVPTPTFKALLASREVIKSDIRLPSPRLHINQAQIEPMVKSIISAFSNMTHVVQLKLRLEEIKRLQTHYATSNSNTFTTT